MINAQSADNLALTQLPAAITVQSPVPNDQSPAAVYLASLGEGSRRTMRTALNIIGELLGVAEVLNEQGQDVRCLVVPWASLRYQHTAAIRAALQERYAPATANKLLAALRRVLKEARRLGQMSADDHDQASDLKNVRGTRLPRGRALGDGEVVSLMRICGEDVTAAGARDAAIIALLRGTGLRRSEAVALDLADYEPPTGAITIRSGKGKKERLTYVAGGAKAALDAWLVVRGQAAGPLFYGITKGGRLVVRRLADQAIAVICAARATEAGVAPFTPIAGHADSDVTDRYVHVSLAAMREVIERMEAAKLKDEE